ncbi:PEGA domain-containing protein [Candidatus Poribacteria bacterium]|nr:PEGA domain-containing protein [Candidatus Poribacteria bacterium]
MKRIIPLIIPIILLITATLFAQKGIRVVGRHPPELPEVVYRTGWALLIGINDYPNLPPQYQLNYAVADATELAKLLQTKFGFPKENIIILTNERATKVGILNALAELANPNRVKKDDCVLVFFSGHGQTVPLPYGGEMGFLIPYDAKVDLGEKPDYSQYYRYCIGMDELDRAAKLIPAKHILFLVDSCYSGLALRSLKGLDPNTRGYLKKITRLPVREVITAGRKGEQSAESPDWGHGAFTYELLEGLRTEAADVNDDGVITAMELGAYLKQVVPRVADQTPQFGYLEGEGEFILLPQEGRRAKPAPVAYRIDISSPEGFQVFLNGKLTGQETPTLLTLPAGRYRLRLERAGYKPYEKVVVLGPDHPVETIRATATPLPPPEEMGFGLLYVKAFADGKPTAARVFVDGKGVGETPYTDPAIPVGEHVVKVSKPLYHEYQRRVTIEKDRKHTVLAVLRPGFGSLEVESTPSGAEVALIDSSGTRRGSGRTPLKLDRLPSGSYQLQVSKDRYHPQSETVFIRDGEVTKESVTLRPRFGTLNVESDPAGATVLLAGEEKGVTPLKVEVDAGRYVLELHKDLYMDWSGEVEIREGETTDVSRKLTPNFGVLDVQVTPEGAKIMVDGREMGRTPAKLRLSPGAHKVEVIEEGYVPKVYETVFIVRDRTERLEGELERKMGTLRVISTPPEARIFVDGRDCGQTPNVLRLPAGSHRLKLSKEGFRDYEETVDIPWRGTVERKVKLPTGPPPLITGKDGAPMVLIPAGEFQMGDHFNEGGFDERPVHTVYLDAFYIDKYEVTNELYARFLNDIGRNEDDEGHQLLDINDSDCLIEFVGGQYRPKAGYENHPVIEVSWWGAKAYAEWAGKRLPTEAEWEKAARGGLVGKRYVWGDEMPPRQLVGNFADETAKRKYPGWTIVEGYDDGYVGTAPVGSFVPNGYGLYDMAGNVWEWCADWYDENYYSRSPRRNPKGPDLAD